MLEFARNETLQNLSTSTSCCRRRTFEQNSLGCPTSRCTVSRPAHWCIKIGQSYRIPSDSRRSLCHPICNNTSNTDAAPVLSAPPSLSRCTPEITGRTSFACVSCVPRRNRRMRRARRTHCSCCPHCPAPWRPSCWRVRRPGGCTMTAALPPARPRSSSPGVAMTTATEISDGHTLRVWTLPGLRPFPIGPSGALMFDLVRAHSACAMLLQGIRPAWSSQGFCADGFGVIVLRRTAPLRGCPRMPRACCQRRCMVHRLLVRRELAEQCATTGDVGSPASQLRKDFPMVRHSLLVFFPAPCFPHPASSHQP